MEKHYLVRLTDNSGEDGPKEFTIDFISDPEDKDALLEALNVIWLEAKVIEETTEEFETFSFGYYDANENLIEVNWVDG